MRWEDCGKKSPTSGRVLAQHASASRRKAWDKSVRAFHCCLGISRFDFHSDEAPFNVGRLLEALQHRTAATRDA